MMPTLFAQLRRHLRHPPPPARVLLLLTAVLAYGTTGFLYFELPVKPDLRWADGLWWTLVTITTVGYGDFFPTTLGGRFLVALPCMMFGIGLLGYILSLSASALVEAKNKELHGMSAVRLTGHVVILNFPGLGKVTQIIEELCSAVALGVDTSVVLVDDELVTLPPELVAKNVRFVRGNPARDETLARASIDAAAYAIILSKDPGNPRSDDRNLAITLAIEARSRSVHTVVECVDLETEELLRKAGCDSIVCTSRFDAHFVTSEALAPGTQAVVDELISNQTGQQLYMTKLSASSSFRSLSDTCRARGHVAIGVLRQKKPMLNVADDFRIEPGDEVVTIGATPLDGAGMLCRHRTEWFLTIRAGLPFGVRPMSLGFFWLGLWRRAFEPYTIVAAVAEWFRPRNPAATQQHSFPFGYIDGLPVEPDQLERAVVVNDQWAFGTCFDFDAHDTCLSLELTACSSLPFADSGRAAKHGSQ